MINKKIFNLSNTEIFLIFSLFICWFSISTSFYDIQNLFENKNNSLTNYINFFRQFFNLIIFPILLIIFFKKYKNINFRNEHLFILFFFYFIFQIPGLFLTDNSITNLIYVISSLNILIIFILINIYFDKKKYILIFLITLFMLLIIATLNSPAYVNFFKHERSDTLYTFFSSSDTFFGKQSPRSTGSSRTLLLIMIISFLIFNKFFEKNNFLKIIIYILISTFVLLFQSRTTTTLLIVYIFINYIYEKNFSFRQTIKYLIVYLVIPIMCMYFILIFKQYIHNYNFIENISNEGISSGLTEITKDFRRPIDPQTYSSGRFEDWKNVFKYIDYSIIYGFGAQGDRFLINQSASNGIIYAFSSSGILGLIPFLIFSLLSLQIVIKNLLQNLKHSFLRNYLSSIVILLLLLRSILESSYAVFSVDFIIFYTFINYLNKFSLNDGN